MRTFIRTKNGYYFVIDGKIDHTKLKGTEIFPSLDVMQNHAAESDGVEKGDWCSEFTVHTDRHEVVRCERLFRTNRGRFSRGISQ